MYCITRSVSYIFLFEDGTLREVPFQLYLGSTCYHSFGVLSQPCWTHAPNLLMWPFRHIVPSQFDKECDIDPSFESLLTTRFSFRILHPAFSISFYLKQSRPLNLPPLLTPSYFQPKNLMWNPSINCLLTDPMNMLTSLPKRDNATCYIWVVSFSRSWFLNPRISRNNARPSS